MKIISITVLLILLSIATISSAEWGEDRSMCHISGICFTIPKGEEMPPILIFEPTVKLDHHNNRATVDWNSFDWIQDKKEKIKYIDDLIEAFEQKRKTIR